MESWPIEMLVKYSVGTKAADDLEAKRLTCQTHCVLIGKTMFSLLSASQAEKNVNSSGGDKIKLVPVRVFQLKVMKFSLEHGESAGHGRHMILSNMQWYVNCL